MFSQRVQVTGILVFGTLAVAVMVGQQGTGPSARETMYQRYLEFRSLVKGGSITPHWMADDSSFWYVEGVPANTVIYKVDAGANTKTRMFDTVRVRQAITPLLGREPPYQGLPFAEFTFLDGEKSVKFAVEEKEFILRLDTYTITLEAARSNLEKDRAVAQVVATDIAGHPTVRELVSPDGRSFVGTKDYNVYLRSTFDGRSAQLTADGTKDYEWLVGNGWDYLAQWSPDSSKIAVKKVDDRVVPKLPMVNWLKPTEDVTWVQRRSDFSTTKAGMPLPRTELFILDIVSKQHIRLDTGDGNDQHLHVLGWRPDGSELFLVRADRLLKKLDLMAANPATGATRVIVTETQKTFVDGLGVFYNIGSKFSLFPNGRNFIWISERGGWNHLYLYDLQGNLIRQLTAGEFPAVRIEGIDAKRRWVYFTAHGDRQRPYDTHLYRVNLESNGVARLTEEPGQHRVQFSPSREFFIDVHSAIDRPPRTDLRRADGTRIHTVSSANIEGFKELRWTPPEEFMVKAADGTTDLYGVLYKPYDFDPRKKYPVIEFVYPFSASVQRGFDPGIALPGTSAQALAVAQLGFITFMVDGRGTPERGKQFLDVAYRNTGGYEVPDHLGALKQLAAQRPFMDLSRMGIAGHSAGGYLAVRALLLEPDVYKVAVASAPLTDFHDGNFAELNLGLPQENQELYEFASNLRLVDKLKGKLLLIHSTSDFSAPFSGTVKMIDALIRANKPYDLIIVPEQDHVPSAGIPRTYWVDAMKRYFQEHLNP